MSGLSLLMQQMLPDGGVWLPEKKAHMEIMDQSNTNVWMTVDAVSQQQFDDYSPPDNWRKVGRAVGAMDQALFRHSPDGDTKPVLEQVINELRFIHVARPAAPSQSASGLIEISVNKSHVLGFDAGREVSVLHYNDQCFIEVVGNNLSDNELPLANGAIIETIKLNHPRVVSLPEPTQTLWAFSPKLRSFQGPIELPQH